MAAVSVHGVDIEIAIACRGKDNLPAIAGDGGLGVVAGSVGEQAQIAAIDLGSVDLVATVDRPDVAMGIVRLGRTLRAGGMRGRVQHAIARGEDVATGCPTFAGADQIGRRRLAVRRIHRHGIDLVTGNALALVLEAQHLVVSREVGFGILSAEGKLTDITQMLLLLRQQQGIAVSWSCCLLRVQQRSKRSDEQNQQQASSGKSKCHQRNSNRNRAECFPHREIVNLSGCFSNRENAIRGVSRPSKVAGRPKSTIRGVLVDSGASWRALEELYGYM